MADTAPLRLVTAVGDPPLLSVVAAPGADAGSPQGSRELRLGLEGELDATTVGLLCAAVTARPPTVTVVVLQLDELTFADAQALRAFLDIDRVLKAAGGRLVLSNPTAFLHRMLRIVGLDVTLDIRPRQG
ncbi:MAG: STAS domain-containing protein [Actinomycetota bacterium]|nr:STAS domain-containing protein [Actinomycetota bacterium]